MCNNIKETTMTDNKQEELFEKPTKTEIKKIRECLVLGSLLVFYKECYGKGTIKGLKSPEGFLGNFAKLVGEKDEQIQESTLIDSIKKQIIKVNKLL